MSKEKPKSDLDKYMEEQYENSVFTKEEIKWWVDLTRLQLKIIKVKAEIGKKKLFGAILKILERRNNVNTTKTK